MSFQRKESLQVSPVHASCPGTTDRASDQREKEERKEKERPLYDHADLEGLLASTLQTLDFPIGWIDLATDDQGETRVICTSGVPAARIGEIGIDSPFYDTVFRKGQPVFTGDHARLHPEQATTLGIVSLASVPLRAGERVIGALTLASTQKHGFTEEECSVLIQIGTTAGGTARETGAERPGRETTPDPTPMPMKRRQNPVLSPIRTGQRTMGRRGQRDTFLPRYRNPREAVEIALKRRERVLQAVNYAAEKFLGASAWEDEIPGVLRQLGEATGASRVYIFKNTTDPVTGEVLMNQVHEWTATRTPQQIDNPALQALPYSRAAPRWQEILSAGRVVAGTVRTFPAIERAYLEPQGVLSLVEAPIFAGWRWWGFIGMDYCTEENLWSPAELDAVPAIGRIIGAAVQRARTEEIYRRPVERSLAGVFIVQDDLLKQANPRFCEIFRYRREELIDKVRLSSLLSLEGRETLDLHMTDPEASFHAELPGRTKDGSEIIVEVFCSSYLYQGKPAVVGTLIEITARKQAERALAKSEEKYREFFKNVTDTILVTEIPKPGREVRILEANDAATAMLGYPHEELLRVPLRDIVDACIDDRTGEITQTLLATRHCRVEGAFFNRERQAILVEVNLHLFTQNGQDVVLSIARDITERKRMEEEAREAYQQIERNMGQFAVLNDEIRNPLQGIIGFAALEESPLAPKIIELAREIDGIVSELDRGWVESDKVRDVLKRQYGLFDEVR